MKGYVKIPPIKNAAGVVDSMDETKGGKIKCICPKQPSALPEPESHKKERISDYVKGCPIHGWD